MGNCSRGSSLDLEAERAVASVSVVMCDSIDIRECNECNDYLWGIVLGVVVWTWRRRGQWPL